MNLRYRVVCAALALAIPSPLTAQQTTPNEFVLALNLPDGTRQRVLYATPDHPQATLVMLPGGAGEIELRRDGDIRHDDNFVVRTRSLWVAQNYAVLIPDTIDHENLRGLRSSPAYAAIVTALVQLAQTKAAVPVFLLGTSQGSIAAMNGAAHAHPYTLAGVVLTESVSRVGHSGETVFDADPQDVRVPALVVANYDDQCDVAPPQDAPRIAAAMSHSPDVRIIHVSGGIDKSARTCGSLSPHGYYGIEARVVDAISAWIKDHMPTKSRSR
ncbi:MAG: alpha/beta hydrolase [Methylovirgula sp.]|uniref:alpha/beta hydrolase n=1 Tax=Methylovirgula sp. TaxID=1978224 RepID=UPI0030762DAD